MEKIIVIGGGAAGLMAAITAAEAGCTVTVFEKMPRPARKLMITGKGRCNLTNRSDPRTVIENVCRNGRFLYSAVTAFTPEDTMAFFEGLGVPLKTERGNRVFPVSDKSVDIVDALVGRAYALGVHFMHVAVEQLLVENGRVTGLKTVDGRTVLCEKIILATGGCSYPATGSTGDGYSMARALGHTVGPLRPALVPLAVHEGFCSQLSGLALKNVTLTITENGKTRYEQQGEMLFTHFGISGPLVLSASSALGDTLEMPCMADIDLKPALSAEQLDRRLLRDFEDCKNKEILHAMDKLLPKSLIPVVIAQSGVDAHQRVNALSRSQRGALVGALKRLRLTVTGFRPFEEAIITRGGIDVREVDPKTMASKLVSGLSFAGEVLDVDAYTGGFNLQIAFSTGHLAGMHI